MFYVIKHVTEEGPGIFTPLLPEKHKVLLAGADNYPDQLTNIDGVLILGGPMGVYEKDVYPFIQRELDFIKKCYEKNIKILGICLGAQMIAEALGGKVYKGHVQEIGWYNVDLTEASSKDPLFSIFPNKHCVFQWHQDTFELPKDAILLAKSENYPNQAFRVGKNIYGLQYHIEVDGKVLKEWFKSDDTYKSYLNTNKFLFLKPLAETFFKKFLSL